MRIKLRAQPLALIAMLVAALAVGGYGYLNLPVNYVADNGDQIIPANYVGSSEPLPYDVVIALLHHESKACCNANTVFRFAICWDNYITGNTTCTFKGETVYSELIDG